MTSSTSTPAIQPPPPAPGAWPSKYQGPTLLPTIPVPATIPPTVTVPTAGASGSRSI